MPPIRGAENVFGHIIEMTPPDGDHARRRFAGNAGRAAAIPSVAEVGALWNPGDVGQWLVRLPRQCRGRCARAAVDRDRPGRALADRTRRRSLCAGNRRRAAAHGQAVLPLPGRRRDVRPVLHAGRETLFVAVQHPGTDGTDATRASSGPRPSRTRPRAGRISSPTCRRGPRCSPSPRRAAARSPERLPRLARLLKKPRTACELTSFPVHRDSWSLVSKRPMRKAAIIARSVRQARGRAEAKPIKPGKQAAARPIARAVRGGLYRRRHRGAGGARAGAPAARHVYRRHRREGDAPPLRRGAGQRHGRGGRGPRRPHRGRVRGRRLPHRDRQWPRHPGRPASRNSRRSPRSK